MHVIDRLNAEFVNTWLVLPQFETAAEAEAAFESEAARAAAAAIRKAYSYPVDSLVLTPEREVVSELAVDELFQLRDFEAWDRRYLKLLADGLARTQTPR